MPGPGSTFLGGPVMSGTRANVDVGTAVLTQQATLVQNSTAAVSATINVPTASQIIDILVDTTVAWNSATSATLSVGAVAGGTTYASGIDVKTAAVRIRPTFTAAQLAAMQNLLTSPTTPIVVTVTPVGATSAGTTIVTFVYTYDVSLLTGST